MVDNTEPGTFNCLNDFSLKKSVYCYVDTNELHKMILYGKFYLIKFSFICTFTLSHNIHQFPILSRPFEGTMEMGTIIEHFQMNQKFNIGGGKIK